MKLSVLCHCRNFDQLIPDAPELILNYLEGEQDASCKRNAFMMLTHVDRVSVNVCVHARACVCVIVCACLHACVCLLSFFFLGTSSGLPVHLY